MKKLKAFVAQNRFVEMIALSVAVALLSTAIAIFVYISSGEINVDLSRPGYEPKNQVEEDEANGNFAPTGPLNQAVIADFSARLDKVRSKLSSVDDFSGETLDDRTLGIAE